MQSPIKLSDEQMTAIFAASHPLPPDVRGPFLEACARELAALPEIGDGAVFRIVTMVQKQFFDPPDTSRKWGVEFGRRSKLKDAEPIEGHERDRRYRSGRARV